MQLFRENLVEVLADKKKDLPSLTSYEARVDMLTKNMIVSIPSVLGMFQVFALYFYAHFMKTGKPWNVDYTATYLALHLDFFRLPLGTFFMDYPTVLQWLTWAVKGWQFWGAVFLFLPLPSPVFQQYLRLFGSIGFLAMHLGFGACLRLDMFLWISLGGVFFTFPSVWWDEIVYPFLSNWRYAPFKTDTVLIKYPRSCASSRFLARVFSVFFFLPSTRMQSYTSSGSDHESDHLWIFVDETGRSHNGLNAWVKILKMSPLLFPFGWILSFSIVFSTVGSLRRQYYTWEKSMKTKSPTITSHGDISPRLFDDDDSPRMKQLEKKRKRSRYWIALSKSIFAGICSFFILWFIICSNEESINRLRYLPISYPPHFVQQFCTGLDLVQRWSMFAPQPPSTTFHHVIEGTLANGHIVDLLGKANFFKWEGGNDWRNNQSISWGPPEPIATSIGSHRWFKFYEHGVVNPHFSRHVVPSLSRWICRKWNGKRSGQERLVTFKIWEANQQVLMNKMRGPLSKRIIWTHQC